MFNKKKNMLPEKPQITGLDIFIISTTLILTIGVWFKGGVELLAMVLSGYAVTIGTIIVLMKFPVFKWVIFRFHRWFDFAVLFSGFVFAPTISMMLVITYAGLLLSTFFCFYIYYVKLKSYNNYYGVVNE